MQNSIREFFRKPLVKDSLILLGMGAGQGVIAALTSVVAPPISALAMMGACGSVLQAAVMVSVRTGILGMVDGETYDEMQRARLAAASAPSPVASIPSPAPGFNGAAAPGGQTSEPLLSNPAPKASDLKL